MSRLPGAAAALWFAGGAAAATGAAWLMSKARSLSSPAVKPAFAFRPSADQAQARQFLSGSAPALDGSLHKGQGGRIGVLGGSKDYTGAPYYAGMAALKAGAELVWVFCAEEAATAIKTYSPELMVTPVYAAADTDAGRSVSDTVVGIVGPRLKRLQALVVGPGLGTDSRVLEAARDVVKAAVSAHVPLVIDADGIRMLVRWPGVIRGYKLAILTPNRVEFDALWDAVMSADAKRSRPASNNSVSAADASSLSRALGSVVILAKGRVDTLSNGSTSSTSGAHGAPRRSGGIGDVLAGVTALCLAWARGKGHAPVSDDTVIGAARAACTIVRMAWEATYRMKKRSAGVPDMFDILGCVVENMCPASLPGAVTTSAL